MPMNGYTVGRDVAIDINTPGGLLRLGGVTDFDRKQVTTQVKVRPIGQKPAYLELPDGWDGTMAIERKDSLLDDFIAQLEVAYYAGVEMNGSRITETITEVDGSLTQYRYNGVFWKLDDAGSVKQNDTVKMKLGWCASDRVKMQ
jgi:hypothetical protein